MKRVMITYTYATAMKYNEATALVYDFGLYVPLAIRLSQDFKKVYYFNPYKADYPTRNAKEIGAGFKEIEKVYNFWDVVDKVDLFIFPNILDGDLQMHLEKMGKLVWGSREGEAMEIHRSDFIKYQQKIGMDVPPTKEITGIDALRKELYSGPAPRYVKMEANERGDSETFPYISEEITEILDIRPLESTLGSKASTKEFIVQDNVEAKCETGYDGFTIDGQFPATTLLGIEVKDMGYIGRVQSYDELPEGVKITNAQLAPALKGYGFRGSFHTEVREGVDGKHYMIDVTARCGYPPTNLLMEIWENMGECMFEGAKGNLIDMKFRAKFGIEVEMFSQAAEENDYTLFFPEELKQWIKQPYSTFKEGRIWVTPQAIKNNNVGSLVAMGDTMEECIATAKKRADQIIGRSLKIDFACLDSAVEELKKL